MEKGKGEIVLITGGSGFIGQHIVRVLQERDSDLKEIRIVDLVKYENRLNHTETKKIVSFIGDICEPKTIDEAFIDVDCVFHCAAFISFEYPPNRNELERVNVNGTRNVIDLCVKHSVSRLIYTSTTMVTLVSYLNSSFSIIVNQTEHKAKPPTIDSNFLIKSYPPSKYRGEKLVLSVSGRLLSNGKGYLKTCSLRPTIVYGEEDYRFFPRLIEIGEKFNGKIPRIAGGGGKHQMCYAGNVAWAHLCAKETLGMEENKINGLPIFVTDNTPVEDTFRFCQRISSATNKFKLEPSWWSIPYFITYFIAFLLETFIKYFNKIIINYNKTYVIKLKYSPCSIASYTSSLLLYNRLRASIHLDYEPIYNEQKSIQNSAKFYEKWHHENIEKNRKKKS